MDLVPLQQVECSWTRDQSHVPCIGRQMLIYCTTREVLFQLLFMFEISHNKNRDGENYKVRIRHRNTKKLKLFMTILIHLSCIWDIHVNKDEKSVEDT